METIENIQLHKDWQELKEKKNEFQSMTKLLLEFDERSGRLKYRSNQSLHYIRKAISICEPELLQVWLRHQAAYIYEVIVFGMENQSMYSTSWLHEDGIWIERQRYQSQPNHPVHDIVCLTDLYLSSCEPVHIDTIDNWVLGQMDFFCEEVS